MPSSRSKYYILAGANARDDRECVLKQGDTFAIFDRFGDVRGEQGLFHEDTRFVSSWVLRLENQTPLLLSSSTDPSGTAMTAHLTNSDTRLETGGTELLRGTLHLSRSKFLWKGTCYERLSLFHYGSSSISIKLRQAFDADFLDIFALRGTARESKGRILEAISEGNVVRVRYESLDRVPRSLRIVCSDPPALTRRRELEFKLELSPGHERELYFCLCCETSTSKGPSHVHRASHERAAAELKASLEKARAAQCVITTTSARFNEFLQRSLHDLSMMLSETPEGPYPDAGVPWFSTPFGRDGILTALEVLWLDPSIARGVLRFLAVTQATETDPEILAEPGKILHEARRSEMANLGEVPFGRHYGSIDATPLFVILAGAYYESTADLELITSLWPKLELALQWMENFGDRDGDGFLEYDQTLGPQGWKDSPDAIFHADGSDALGPVALCEVQAYAYAAYTHAHKLARVLNLPEQAQRYETLARDLRSRFEAAFWCEELGTYALALDGKKQPCRIRSSNAGHCLWTGVASKERAARLAQTLFEHHSFSGWGIRTLSSEEARYNPMAYHNGSVWPHDNAFIGAGLSSYGHPQHALRILLGLYESTLHTCTPRLPELFCGFSRVAGEGPTVYPVACSPQVLAACAPLLLLKACLGLTIDAPNQRVQFVKPILPPFLNELSIQGLRVGTSTVDLALHRYPEDVGIHVLGRTGPVEIINVK